MRRHWGVTSGSSGPECPSRVTDPSVKRPYQVLSGTAYRMRCIRAIRPTELRGGQHGSHGTYGTGPIRAQIRAQPTRSKAVRRRRSPAQRARTRSAFRSVPGHISGMVESGGCEGRFARQPARWSIPRPGLQSGHPHGVRPPSSGRNSIEQTCSVGSQCRPWHSWLQSTECRQVQSTAGLVAIAISPLAASRALAPGRHPPGQPRLYSSRRDSSPPSSADRPPATAMSRLSEPIETTSRPRLEARDDVQPAPTVDRTTHCVRAATSAPSQARRAHDHRSVRASS
jgi:hypothetical protein